MNGSWDIQRVLVASRQANLRFEADTTRLAAAATQAASAERTRHAETGDTEGHMVRAPRAIAATAAVKPAVQSTAAAATGSTCSSIATCNERTLAA
jgi:hypothetical protein